MAQSFDDWKNQIAINSITGGVLGTPTSGDSAISADVAGSDLYSKSRQDLVGKMGSDIALQQMYQQGVTPEQMLSGSTPGATPNLSSETPQTDALYRPRLFNDPTKETYNPEHGITNTSGFAKTNDFADAIQAGGVIPMLGMAMMGGFGLGPALMGATGLGDVAAGLGLSESAGSSLLGGALNAGVNLAEGNKFNPMSLVGSALGAFGGGLGIPSNLTPFIGPAIRAATGGGFNPVQLALALA